MAGEAGPLDNVKGRAFRFGLCLQYDCLKISVNDPRRDDASMLALFDTVLHAAAIVYARACGGRLPADGADAAGIARRPRCVAIQFAMAAPLLALSLPIEFLLPAYLRFLILVWIAAVFFFIAAVDRRAGQIEAGQERRDS